MKRSSKRNVKQKEITLKEAFRVILRTLRVGWSIDKLNYLSRFFFTTTEVVGVVFSTYIGSRVLGELVQSVGRGSATPGLYKFAIAEGIILLAVNISSALSGLSDRIMFIKWDKWFTLELNRARSNLDTEYFEDRENQKLLNKIDRKGVWAVEAVSNNTVYLYYNLLKMALIIGSVFVLGPIIIILIVLASIPRIYAEIKRSKLEWGIWAAKGDEYHIHQKTIGLFKDQKNLIEIKLYGLRDKLLHGVAGKNIDNFSDTQVRAAKSTLGAETLAHATYEGAFLGVTLYLLKKTVDNSISIANFSFYAGVLGQFSSSMRNLSSIISRSSESILYTKDVYSVLNAKPKILSKPGAMEISKNHIPEIKFNKVSFAYRSNPKSPIFKELSFTVKPGEHLAIVGENGAGKTTLIKLLLRLYDVTSGEILIDGTNIKDIDLDTYWRVIGVLFQDFNRYPFDVQTNIEFGRFRAKSTPKKINQAVALADLDKNIRKLPKGLKTILDNSFEEGVEPSGGQWQRVALARAFYRDSGILILDEPTAAVDANAEYHIFNNIFEHYSNKTAIIISHRFSTVRRADRIIVLDKGQIEESGTHTELLKKNGLYAEMFNKQAAGYKP